METDLAEIEEFLNRNLVKDKDILPQEAALNNHYKVIINKIIRTLDDNEPLQSKNDIRPYFDIVYSYMKIITDTRDKKYAVN